MRMVQRFLGFLSAFVALFVSAAAFAADNSDSIMVVCDDKGLAAPTGWTRFQSDGIIARRVPWSDFKKLDLVGYKAILVSVFQYNSSGQSPFRTDYDGNDSYGFEHNSLYSRMLITKYKASGSGAGTTRNAKKDSVASGGQGGGESETWPTGTGQVPILGVVFQDASPNSTKLNAARALTTDSVPSG